MGCCRRILGGSAVFVAFLAFIVGLFLSGIPEQLKFFDFFDQAVSTSNPLSKETMGDLPVFHAHHPWRFTHDTLDAGALEGKTYLVTGANVGLGYWTAHFLADKGAHVVLACRSPRKCTAASQQILSAIPSASLEILDLDLSNLEAVHTSATKFLVSHESLDGLILNAGMGLGVHQQTGDGIEMAMAVNHFGHFYLTQLLLPLLEATGTDQRAATIVVVTSRGHFECGDACAERMLSLAGINDKEAYNTNGSLEQYGMSKLANILFTQELSARLTERKAHVIVNAAHPGAVNTDFGRHAEERIRESIPVCLGDLVIRFMYAVLTKIFWHGRDAALTQVACAVAPSIVDERVTGRYFHPILRENVPSLQARNGTVQAAFWDFSEKVLSDKTAAF